MFGQPEEPFQPQKSPFDFGFQEPDLKSKNNFENFHFDPAGEMTAPFKSAVPPGDSANPQSINFDNTVRDYLSRQQQLNNAFKQQKAIDDLYQKVVDDALIREVTVVPPDNFDLTAKPMKNITPPEDLAEIIKLKEQLLKKNQPVSKPPPPNPDLDLAPPTGHPGAKSGGYKTIPNPGTVPNNTPEFRPNPKPQPNPVPNPLPKDLPPPPSPKGYFPPPPEAPLPKPAKFPKSGLGGAAIGGLVDFGIRVATGEAPQKAAYGAAGGVAGSIIGAALGGPLGGFVGGVVGGAIADFIFDVAFPPTFDRTQDPVSLKRVRRGKNYVVYRIKWTVSFEAFDRHGNPYTQTVNMDRFVWGPIEGYTESNIPKISYLSPHTLGYGPVIFCGGEWGGPEEIKRPSTNPDFIWALAYFDYPVDFKYRINIISIEREDGYGGKYAWKDTDRK